MENSINNVDYNYELKCLEHLISTNNLMFLDEIFSNLIVKKDPDRFPAKIFFFKEKELIVEFDLLSNNFIFNYEIYSLLLYKLQYSASSVNKIISTKAKEYLNFDYILLLSINDNSNIKKQIENHFNKI